MAKDANIERFTGGILRIIVRRWIMAIRELFRIPLPRWFFFWLLSVRVPYGDRLRHTHITGGSGSGKSELVKVLTYDYYRRNNAAVFLICPHGDLADEVSTWRDHLENPERLVYIAPGISREHRIVINPLEITDHSPENVDRVTGELVGVFRELLPKADLSAQMATILTPCISVLLKREGSTLADLMRFMDEERNEDLVILGQKSDNQAHAEFFCNTFFAHGYKMTKLSIATRLQSLLNSAAFYAMTIGPSTINIEKELDRGRFVVCNLAKGRVGEDTSIAFGRFLVARVQAHVLRRCALSREQRRPIHMIIDEFQNFISPSIGKILTESRKFGLHLTASQQMLGQNMEAEFQQLTLGNAHIKIAGSNEYKTRAGIAREVGIEAKDFRRLGRGHFMVSVGAYNPFRLPVPRFLLGNRRSMK